MPAARRAVRRTGRRTARRTSARVNAAAPAPAAEPEPQYFEAPQEQAPPLEQEPAPAPAPDEDEALVDRLKELGDMHDQGVLTDAQFEQAKNRLID